MQAPAISLDCDQEGERAAMAAGFRHERCARRWIRRRGDWCAALLLVAACGVCAGQTDLPDAPAPAFLASAPGGGAPVSAAPAEGEGQEQTFPPLAQRQRGRTVPGLQPTYVPLPQPCVADACSEVTRPARCCEQNTGTFDEYLKNNAIHIYTPRELARIAWRGVVDPFNLLTIGATSAYSVETDSHSPYGPGAMGIAKLSGVSLTQDMTGAFFGTFLIPSIDHQDPHYHRMPNVSLVRRIAHCVYQPFWTDSDRGEGMVNYSTIVGSVADEAVDITYVPYQQLGWGPSAERIATGWATDPIGNFVTEFVPDVARHINLNIVFVQRIINRVAIEEGAGSP